MISWVLVTFGQLRSVGCLVTQSSANLSFDKTSRNGVELLYGSAVPDLDFTSDASTASINPSTLTSSRKFVSVTALPD